MQIQEKGAIYTLKMDHLDDMERQVVKSDTAVFRVEDLDIEMPAGIGKLTNVEGLLAEVLKDLEYGQKKRLRENPELHDKIEAIVQPLIKMMLGTKYPFTITLDDPAGNSWIEPSPEYSEKKYIRKEYARTPEQNANLGLSGESDGQDTKQVPTEIPEEKASGEFNKMAEATLKYPEQTLIDLTDDDGNFRGEFNTADGLEITNGISCSVPCTCPGCSKDAHMNLQMLKIPYFKEVLVSAVVCSECGYKTNDVKTGGAIPDKGKRIWLDVKEPRDLHRDILKSETCMLTIPTLRVEVVPGTMGGRFTTVEGLLVQIRHDLHGSIFDMEDVAGSGGDSMPGHNKAAWTEFFARLDQAIKGELAYTILMEDPLANSYVQSFHAPDPDPQLTSEEYERTAEEEVELGIADMKTHRNADGEYVKEVKEATKETETVKEITKEPEKDIEDTPKETEKDAQEASGELVEEL